MFLIRITATVLIAVGAAILAALVDTPWVTVLAVVIMVAGILASVLVTLHYSRSPEWLGSSEEAQLEEAGLVEAETGLPTRARWHELRGAGDAEGVKTGGLVAVPRAWRAPEGDHRVLLITTEPLGTDLLKQAAPDIEQHGLAVQVIVPTLAETAARLRLGDPTEAVAHAQAVVTRTTERLAADGVQVAGHIGGADPAVALSDGLRTFDAEHVIVARHRRSGRYLEEVDVQSAAAVFGVPITEIDLDSTEA
jgi:hypothetical protein